MIRLFKGAPIPRSGAGRGKAMGRMGVMRRMGIKQKKQIIHLFKDSPIPRSRTGTIFGNYLKTSVEAFYYIVRYGRIINDRGN